MTEPTLSFADDGTPIVPNVLLDWRAFTKERDVNAPGSGHNLRNYWVHGEGAAKIGWGTDGSFARCVTNLGKYVKDPQGLCAEYHKAATGEWPAEKGVESVSTTETFHGTHNQDSHGNWADGPDESRELSADEMELLGRDPGRRDTGDPNPVRLTDLSTLDLRRLVAKNNKNRLLTADELETVGRDPGLRDNDGKPVKITSLTDEELRKLLSSSFAVSQAITAADNPKKPYGDVKYADPGYQEDGKSRYPLDTDDHVRAAWSYINQPDNAAKYSPDNLRQVKSRIRRAMKGIGAEVTAAGGLVAPSEEVTVAEGDCPPGHHKMDDGNCMPDGEMEEQTEAYTIDTAPKTAPWRGVLTVEGVESGDGRMFAANALTWDEPPLPLMWQKETSHGGSGDKSVRVGSIHKVWREPDPAGRANVYTIRGEGTFDLNNVDGLEAYRRMAEGDMRGNSVDVDSVKGADVELVYPESTAGPIAAGDDTEDVVAPPVNVFAEPELTIYKKGRIRASTMVEIPAFTEARLELMDEVITAATAAEFIEELENGTQVVEEAMAAIIAATKTIEINEAPPREWFTEPTDVTAAGALTITAQGRVYGYIAPAGVRHRSFGNKPVYVPIKNVDYSRFMGGETIVADGGRVTTGAITMGCGHATTDYPLNALQAKDHYDNSCALVATACVGENKHGVWIAGALLSDVTRDQIQRMMACRLSGDWRPHLDKPGWRELTAALLVPVPGFPMARTSPSVQVEEAQLVASSIPVQFVPEEQLTPQAAAAAIVRQVRLQQLRARVSAFHGTHNQKSHGNRGGRSGGRGDVGGIGDNSGDGGDNGSDDDSGGDVSVAKLRGMFKGKHEDGEVIVTSKGGQDRILWNEPEKNYVHEMVLQDKWQEVGWIPPSKIAKYILPVDDTIPASGVDEDGWRKGRGFAASTQAFHGTHNQDSHGNWADDDPPVNIRQASKISKPMSPGGVSKGDFVEGLGMVKDVKTDGNNVTITNGNGKSRTYDKTTDEVMVKTSPGELDEDLPFYEGRGSDAVTPSSQRDEQEAKRQANLPDVMRHKGQTFVRNAREAQDLWRYVNGFNEAEYNAISPKDRKRLRKLIESTEIMDGSAMRKALKKYEDVAAAADKAGGKKRGLFRR